MDLDTRVLIPFLRANGQFVSGASIAEELQLSRVSVHKHLEHLKTSGFTFSAIRNKGYQLTREPVAFHPVLFEALLAIQPCSFFEDHIALGEVDSTNTVAERELSSGRPTPFFVVADCQTAGRGRRGRNWHSPQHKNLYLSIALRPSLPPSRLQTITLWLGLRLCQLLRDTYSLPVQIKWPNDLLIHGRKIAGMLTEARVDSEFTRDLVFGLGLNVNTSETDFPEELHSIASSLSMNLGQPLNLSRIAHRIVHHLSDAIQDYLNEDYADELAHLWPEFDFLRGQGISTEQAEGTAVGITRNGSLRVEREDGSIAILHSGEVSLRKS
ncbi:biotin--[acetyl-CoA-carboxylase] ligase [Puniceicoccales bacterium CK1056]|uniref:Bifunctional ligase/repressor BirA n=1 Tax=Oceanipulchritudo coccoides TaxID=2706888 RepID=A0A6B2M1M3_9BACT|nr:biotin--[acetyl-CoA-carboxylase] ligase [Oceanipulchritudo coccoides]NDV61685.1 biotin--[acetyl-CoA-carboxylase] ligase [Oceanipulchritudo coccoides]